MAARMQKITPFLWFNGKVEEAMNFLGEMLGDPDPEKSQSIMKAMLQMTKIDIKGLKHAYDQR